MLNVTHVLDLTRKHLATMSLTSSEIDTFRTLFAEERYIHCSTLTRLMLLGEANDQQGILAIQPLASRISELLLIDIYLAERKKF